MKSTWRVGWSVAGFAVLAACVAEANNIQVARVALQGQDTVAKTVKVVFDVSWENSWRGVGAGNWDAAWVFVKFRAPGSNDWQHAALSANSSDHTPAADSTVTAAPGGAGALVYRSSGYTGSVNYAQVKLLWNYGSNGYAFVRGAQVEVSVHAIEMVYVAQGPFYLGSGGTENNHFYRYTDGSQSTNPFLVSAATETSAVTVAATAGSLYYTASGNAGDALGPIPAAFPKGHNAFYSMKYAITQGQYRDFLNKLTRAQQGNRTGSQTADYFAMSANAAIQYRNGIRCPSVIPGSPTNIVFGCDGEPTPDKIFDEVNDGQDRSCNLISIDDSNAYLDWAGLRPMTELEYEKACRGFAYPVPGEYAWGNATKVPLTAEGGLVGSGSATVGIPAGANCGSDGAGTYYPTRVGIFATNGSSRASAGATYWGIMEMSGNGALQAVSVGNATGRAFTGLHGNGVLTATGYADVTGWPNSGITPGIRGGGWHDQAQAVAVSDRSNASSMSNTRGICYSARGVRTAP